MADKNYKQNIFINCPFDNSYKQFFDAIVFTVSDCGFSPHCALEINDGTQPRIEKIIKIIKKCQFSIHDLSETTIENKLPRFNMPLELGIFFGAKAFGINEQKKKDCLILDTKEHRYLQFISDIRGLDISVYEKDQQKLISKIRNWLRHKTTIQIPGGEYITERYNQFLEAIPTFCERKKLDEDLEYTDFINIVSIWAEKNPLN